MVIRSTIEGNGRGLRAYLARTRPWQEQITNEFVQWDRALSSTIIRGGLGFSFGVILSVLLFKRRAWPVFFGTGFGVGRAWEEADGKTKLFLGQKSVLITRQ